MSSVSGMICSSGERLNCMEHTYLVHSLSCLVTWNWVALLDVLLLVTQFGQEMGICPIEM